MGNLQGYEVIIILLLVLLLFGAKRLPDTARGLGRSLRIFKAETKGLRDDDEPASQTVVQAQPQIAPAPTQPQPDADQLAAMQVQLDALRAQQAQAQPVAAPKPESTDR